MRVDASKQPAVDHDWFFGPVGLLTHNVDKLQDAFDGVDGGDAVIRPGCVVEVEDVPTLVSLQGDQDGVLARSLAAAGRRWPDLRIPA